MLALLQRGEAVACRLVARGCAAAQARQASAGAGDLKPLTPIPANDYERKAVIYKPSPPAAQYGYDQKAMGGGTKAPWKIWLPTQEMWSNPLIGWASSSDTAESAFRKMAFTTPEQAANFLEKQGIEYTIEEKPPNFAPTTRPTRFATYGDNFSTKRGGTPDLSHLPSNRGKR